MSGDGNYSKNNYLCRPMRYTMEKIVEHIEHLLLWHDCVIIPDFGGFVLQQVPAVYTDEKHLFVPAHKEIVFNPTLTHNDGLLTESYMQEYAVDFTEALKYVKADVLAMKECLDDDSHIRFGRTGLFVKEDDRIVFVPAKNSDERFCTSSYGLPVFYYLSLAARQQAFNGTVAAAVSPEEKPSRTDDGKNRVPSGNIIYAIPVTRTFIQVFIAAVAAAVIFFLISTPVKDVNRDSYSASFVPREIMPAKTAGEIVSDAFSASEAMTGLPVDKMKETAVNIPEETVEKETGSATKPETEIETETKVKPEMSVSVPKSPGTSSFAVAKSPATQPPSSVKTSSKAVSGKYYVIIGSYMTVKQAQIHLSRLKGDIAAHAGIIESDGKVRVYAQQFPGEKAAQSYLNTIRQNPNHQQAWLYKGR